MNRPGIDASGPANPYNPKGNSFLGYNAMKLAWVKNHLTDPNQFYPGIAESWEIAPDNSAITIKLQPNNKWSDGKPVTAEDVRLSIGIAYTQGSTAFAITPRRGGRGGRRRGRRRQDGQGHAGHDQPQQQVRPRRARHLRGPPRTSGAACCRPTSGTSSRPRAVRARTPRRPARRSPPWARRSSPSPPEKDVSASPFILERVNPGEALLVKNKEFYNAANVAPDQVKFLNYTGNEQIWNYLISGKLDHAGFTAAPADVMNRIKQAPGTNIIKGFSPVAVGMAFNQTKKPYDNVHVRRGLAYLIDRAEVTKVASPEGGNAAVTTSGIHQKPSPGVAGRRAEQPGAVQRRPGQGRGGVQGRRAAEEGRQVGAGRRQPLEGHHDRPVRLLRLDLRAGEHQGPARRGGRGRRGRHRRRLPAVPGGDRG
ncbi:ABC transporter substrate-binding protein [Nonomuraea ferruginea]